MATATLVVQFPLGVADDRDMAATRHLFQPSGTADGRNGRRRAHRRGRESAGSQYIEGLLALVDKGEVDQTARLTADRDRLLREVKNLVGSIAAGVPAVQ